MLPVVNITKSFEGTEFPMYSSTVSVVDYTRYTFNTIKHFATFTLPEIILPKNVMRSSFIFAI